MAKITVLLGELSGSIAGNTFSRNKAGAYVRQRVTPTDPKSEAQMAVRSRFANVGSAFHSLTPLQKAAWNAFATSLFTPFGGRIPGVTYTGQQAFMSLNQRLSNAASIITSNYDVSVGSYSGNTFYSLPTAMLETAPVEAFSGDLSGSGGTPIVQQFQGITYAASSGSFAANFAFNGSGSPVLPSAPTWQDPTSGSPTGYLFYASAPVEQEGLAPRDIYKNLVAFVPGPNTFDGSYVPMSTFSVTGQITQVAPRKEWYAAGQTIRISVFALNMQTGQTQLLGSLDTVVQ